MNKELLKDLLLRKGPGRVLFFYPLIFLTIFFSYFYIFLVIGIWVVILTATVVSLIYSMILISLDILVIIQHFAGETSTTIITLVNEFLPNF